VVERDSLTRFLPSPVVESVMRDPAAVDLEGEAQEITALFADLREFTGFAERFPPHAVVQMLNEFFSEMAAEITAHGGIVMQYVGDNLYAVFPEKGGPDHARRALVCALDMVKRLETLNARRSARREPELAMGIGVHTGPVIAGAIGSPELLQYSYVGDTVNTASRIERLTRTLGRKLLVSGTTFARAGGKTAFEGELMPAEPLRGKREAQTIWAVSAARS
jgi:adenylate cyclase